MRRLIGLPAVLVLALLSSPGQEAKAANVWSAPSFTCTPESAEIQNDEYRVVSGSVRFSTGTTGVVFLNCAVSDANISFMKYLFVTFDDTDGGTDYEVTGAVWRLAKSTGTLTNLGGVTSDSYGSTSSPVTGQSAAIDHTPDFSNNYYFVNITVERTGTTNDVGVLGVRITSS
jgi:hypothetical protein